MKIAVLSTPIFTCPPTGYAGLELVAYQTAKGLAAKGHEVALFAPNGSRCEGCSIVPIGEAGRIDEHGAYQSYWKHLPNYQVVIDSSWQKWSYMLKAEGVLKAPILGVLHAPTNTMYQYLPPVEKPCIVCISKDQASHFEGLHNRECRVVYNGCDSEYYRPIEGVERSDRYLFLARFSSIKGADLAIDACIAAGVGLDLVGDTTITNEPEYFEACKKKADGKQIRIIGGVSRSETVWWYSQAKAFLHPNMRFREPLGLAPLEAMSCGLPVVGWRNGALKETINHGVSGLLVKSMDELVAAIKCDWFKNITEDDRKEIRQWVCDNFSVERMVNGYSDLCEEATATGGW